ncbi:hypothetical protein [uncultured Lutibacter sp.]|uniref:hypothetical protein n=1 Tax=uncultured Lutibacter sp. TaxID=437739 RepID=UPI002610BA24|nr:hypothetical protein [uncultured Lutibacter sp.]
MGKQIVFIIALWFAATANAQKATLSFKQVDSTTYALFLKQDWKPIIKMGKQSRTEGIDFYYLKVRMGIAYFKENKMLSAIQFLEEAYTVDNYDVVVQEYLYWAYRYSGLELESRLFYSKMNKMLKDQINLVQPFVSALDFNVLTTNNLDYDEMLKEDAVSENNDIRFISKNYQLFSVGMNHPLSKRVNLYHQLSVMPTTSVQQENVAGILQNETYKGNESRYYTDVTVALGNRWYLDTYLNVIFGKYDNLNMDETIITTGNGRRSITSSSSTINYTDLVFGGSLTKASYFMRNSVNASVSNLNGLNQFQAGYSMALYPLGSTLVVPFGSIQYHSQDPDSNMVFTGGLSINTDKFSLTGFGTVGDLSNFIANNGAIIYNQSATALNEFGLSLQFSGKNSTVKVGYSFMEMEDNYYTEDFNITTKTFNFNQQNITAGITWKF